MSEKRIALILTHDEYEVVKKALQILGDITKIKKAGGEVLTQAPLE